jgi:hypothetical protein
MDLTALIFGVALLVASGGLLAASLRLERLVDFLIAFYLVAFLEVVVVSLALSPARALTRPALLASLVGLLALALALWLLRGRPAPPPAGPALHALREALRDPLLLVLAGPVAVGLVYVTALAFFAPPNDYDVLWYHLARAAFWKQQHAVAYVPLAGQLRINAFPPNAEIADAFSMILARTDRFTSFVQLGALLATMAATFGIARRIGFGPRRALFGALVFATLPIAVLQAPTALNDLVLASLVAATTYFLLTRGRMGLVLAGLALALAMGTKVTAIYALPLLAVVGAFAYPARRWGFLLFTGLAGIALGSFWYVVNVAETGKLAGGLVHSGSPPGPNAQIAQEPFALKVLAFFLRRAVDAIDPAGSVGRDRWLYGLAAAVVLCVGALVSWRRPSRSMLTPAVAAVLTAAALTVGPSYDLFLRAYQKSMFELGRPPLELLGLGRDATKASSYESWFGPVAVPIFLVSVIVVTREVRRGRLPRIAVVLALAPALIMVVLAFGASYQPWDGRWAMLAVPLGCATWGSVLQFRPFAWAVAVVAASTLALVLVHAYERPAGFNVLGGRAPQSVWTTKRLDVMSIYAPLIGIVEKRVPLSETLGLRLVNDDAEVSYPYFGSRLDRTVVFVGPQGKGLARADWLLVSPGPGIPLCRARWSGVAADAEGWRLYRRTGRGRCLA